MATVLVLAADNIANLFIILTVYAVYSLP